MKLNFRTLIVSTFLFLTATGVSAASPEGEEFYRRGSTEEWVNHDVRKAIELYRKAGEAGCTKGWVRIGSICEFGQGVAANPAEGAKYYLLGARAGDALCMANLARMYTYGIGVSADQSEALRWLRASAEAGNGTAMAWLGRRYETGDGVEKNPAEALKWYRLSVDAVNNIDGTHDDTSSIDQLYILGDAYYSGKELTSGQKNYEESIKYLTRVADYFRTYKSLDYEWQRSMMSDALRKLQACYRFGRGTKENLKKANALLEEAARYGDPDLKAINDYINRR